MPEPIETELVECCRRLAAKGLFRSPEDSFSVSIPGKPEALLASGCGDWRAFRREDLRVVSLSTEEGIEGVHAAIYRQRSDVGAVAICSPAAARLLARSGGVLPPLFDEQVRHLGLPAPPLRNLNDVRGAIPGRAFKQGANALLAGEQLVCLGTNGHRTLMNTELYEKCARAYVIAAASGNRIYRIPAAVRWIAARSLRKDERRAAMHNAAIR